MTPTQKIQNWINNFVTQPNPVFGNLPPCPFARKAIVDNKVEFQEMIGNFVVPRSRLFDPNRSRPTSLKFDPFYVGFTSVFCCSCSKITRFMCLRGRLRPLICFLCTFFSAKSSSYKMSKVPSEQKTGRRTPRGKN